MTNSTNLVNIWNWNEKFEKSKILKHFRFGPEVTETKIQPYVQIKTINASTQKIPSLYLEAFLKNALDKITFLKFKNWRNEKTEVTL